jgi:hypothetical protein
MLRVGQPVHVNRERVSSGTWSRFRGRQGWVSAVNRQTFRNGATYVEIGVSWNRPNRGIASTDAWFRDDELVSW